MSAEFGAPTLEFHLDPRTDEAPRWEDHQEPPSWGVDAFDELPVDLPVGRLGCWLDTQPWYADPQPSIAVLADHALHGAWTLSRWARRRRWLWVHTVARVGRLLPLAVLRACYLSTGAAGELPSIASFGEDIAPRRMRAAYVAASVVSRITDYAHRTALAALILWFPANMVGFPETLTVAYWWDCLTALWASVPEAAPSTPSDGLSSASAIGQFVFIAAIIAGWVVLRRRNKQKATPPWGGGSSS